MPSSHNSALNHRLQQAQSKICNDVGFSRFPKDKATNIKSNITVANFQNLPHFCDGSKNLM
jgi:hypothetical protein